jgi:uncharacterized protein YjbJ (UPF0337 family)
VRDGEIMSAKDKVKNSAESAAGKAKQAAGQATGRRDVEERGRRSQVKADLKNSGEQVKDAGRKAKDAFEH